MVLGAGGFIGRHVMVALLAAGHDVVGVVRTMADLPAAFPQIRFEQVDLADATDAQDWRALLQGVDCVVNAAGVLRGRQMEAIHVAMPTALYDGAIRAGVRQIILISAISARDDVYTDYARSKCAGEEALRASGLAWTILRPSLVYGDGSYGGTSLIRGMAGLPFVTPLPGDGRFAFTPIHVRDLAQGVVRVCGNPVFYDRTLEPVGPNTYSLRDLLGRYRAWLGFGRTRFLAIPMPLMRGLGRLGDVAGDGPIATNSLVQLVAGNAGDSAAYAKAIGRRPRSLDDALLARPAQVQDRWHARLFFLAPAIKAMLVLLWLVSAWLGLFHAQEETQRVVAGLGMPQGAALPLRVGSSLADIAVAALVVLDRRARWSTMIQIALVVAYTFTISLATPLVWLDPLGPLFKNLPILLLIATHGAIGDRR
ncbi:SDR family oxidoreductase [Hephaestia caeni]|nr:SDR family oxidoreductase [Hephaestia caeni]